MRICLAPESAKCRKPSHHVTLPSKYVQVIEAADANPKFKQFLEDPTMAKPKKVSEDFIAHRAARPRGRDRRSSARGSGVFSRGKCQLASAQERRS